MIESYDQSEIYWPECTKRTIASVAYCVKKFQSAKNNPQQMH